MWLFFALMKIGRPAWQLSVSCINKDKDKGTVLHCLATRKSVSSLEAEREDNVDYLMGHESLLPSVSTRATLSKSADRERV
jgi:hypothetical protein